MNIWQKILYLIGAPVLYILATIEPPSMYFIHKTNILDGWRDNYSKLNRFYTQELWQ